MLKFSFILNNRPIVLHIVIPQKLSLSMLRHYALSIKKKNSVILFYFNFASVSVLFHHSTDFAEYYIHYKVYKLLEKKKIKAKKMKKKMFDF